MNITAKRCFDGTEHDWHQAPDQANTGTMGVRKRCSKCSKTLVFAEKGARDAKQEEGE